MKIRQWTPQEIEQLTELYQTSKTVAQIAQIIGRSRQAVYVKASNLGLPKKEDPKTIHLDMEQKRWLRQAFPHCRNTLCALRLGISVRAVIRIAHQMKLEKTPEFMAACQEYAAKKAKESHLKNGTYPPKGVINENIAKGAAFRFKPGHVSKR